MRGEIRALLKAFSAACSLLGSVYLQTGTHGESSSRTKKIMVSYHQAPLSILECHTPDYETREDHKLESTEGALKMMWRDDLGAN